MTEAMDERVVKEAAKRVMSYLFEACQPNRGDVFSWCDDHAEQIARAALAASEARQAERAATIARLRDALSVIAYEGPSEPHVVAHSALLASSEPLTALEDQHG